MSLRIRCPVCKVTFRVSDQSAGSGTNCPNCGARVRVPLQRPAAGRGQGATNAASPAPQRGTPSGGAVATPPASGPVWPAQPGVGGGHSANSGGWNSGTGQSATQPPPGISPFPYTGQGNPGWLSQQGAPPEAAGGPAPGSFAPIAAGPTLPSSSLSGPHGSGRGQNWMPPAGTFGTSGPVGPTAGGIGSGRPWMPSHGWIQQGGQAPYGAGGPPVGGGSGGASSAAGTIPLADDPPPLPIVPESPVPGSWGQGTLGAVPSAGSAAAPWSSSAEDRPIRRSSTRRRRRKWSDEEDDEELGPVGTVFKWIFTTICVIAVVALRLWIRHEIRNSFRDEDEQQATETFELMPEPRDLGTPVFEFESSRGWLE